MPVSLIRDPDLISLGWNLGIHSLQKVGQSGYAARVESHLIRNKSLFLGLLILRYLSVMMWCIRDMCGECVREVCGVSVWCMAGCVWGVCVCVYFLG